MTKPKSSNGITAYLHSLGLLEQGTAEEIALAKKEYWNTYKREHKKIKRHECKSFEILLDEGQVRTVEKWAKKAHVSITKFITICALQESEPISPPLIGAIRELLSLEYGFIESLLTNSKVAEEVKDQVLNHLDYTQSRILTLLQG